MKKTKALVLLGPTATGKTAFGVQLAAKLGAEIIGVDSRQVYRGLDIGSGKDLAEYELPDGSRVPYHLIDVRDPDEEYTLADFMEDARNALTDISARGKIPLFVGGTALYLHAMFHSYHLQGGDPDPEERKRMNKIPTEQLLEELKTLAPDSEIIRLEPGNRTRIVRAIEMAKSIAGGERPKTDAAFQNVDFLIFGMLCDRGEVHARIERRLDTRLEQDMLEEGRRLHEQGVSWERLEFLGLEYRQMALFLQGKISRQEMHDNLLIKIRQFAKRQDSWFRRMERDGFPIHWMRREQLPEALAMAQAFLNGETIPPPDFKLSETFYGPRTSFPKKDASH